MKIIIPGRKTGELKYLLLDFNGTIAFDGVIISEVIPLLEEIAKRLEIYVLTADTHGTAVEQCRNFPVTLHRLKSDNHTKEKGDFVLQLGKEHVIAMGNGENDANMLEFAEIGMGIFGAEGCARSIFQVADLCVPGICLGLEMLIFEKRLVATLRK